MARKNSPDTDRLRLAGRALIGAGLVAVAVLAVLLVREVRRVPTAQPIRERSSDVVVPRTDQANPFRNLAGGGAPQSQPDQPAVAEIPIPPERQLAPVKRIPPEGMRDHNTPSPQYTKTLAAPPANPVPPDPFKPPPMDMNSERSQPPY